MEAKLYAASDIRGYRVNLRWSRVRDEGRPGLRLLRSECAYPAHENDSVRVFDLDDLLEDTTQPNSRFERTAFTTFSGLLRGQYTAYYGTGAVGTPPIRVRIQIFDAAGTNILMNDVSRVDEVAAPAPPWGEVRTLSIFHTPGGGAEILAGQLRIQRDHADGITPHALMWTPAGGAATTIDFDQSTTQMIEATYQSSLTALIADITMSTVTLHYEEHLNPDTGEWLRHFTVADSGLQQETNYYYRLFLRDLNGVWSNLPEWRASVMATGDYGLHDMLYQKLPEVHRYYDEPKPEEKGTGQLRRFMSLFGDAFDQIRSLAEGLRGRHNTLTVREEALPRLARGIGWELDQTLDVQAQRNDIAFAPAVFGSVGSIPNIRALVNRATGWDCEIKEFVHNVFLTNAPEQTSLWEIWTSHREANGTWSSPQTVTQTEGFDGHPVSIVSGGQTWLFWHSDRDGRREIWMDQIGMGAPRRASVGAPDDSPDADYLEEQPAAIVDGAAVVLFWHSNRDGYWNIWSRRYTAGVAGAAEKLTDNRANDLYPTAVVRGADIWLFWQSNRRGINEIWSRVFSAGTWGIPRRITQSQFPDGTPCAVVDPATNDIWLFWVRDSGDHSTIYSSRFDGAAWTAETEVTTAPQQRDESPSAVFWDGLLWLFWHSNRSGAWRIWSQDLNSAVWSTPEAVTPVGTDDKEPGAVVVPSGDPAGELRIYWRSQRRGNLHKSRTVDFNDPAMVDAIRTRAVADRSHYSYDIRTENIDWYARDAVGLILLPDTNDGALISRRAFRARTFVENFRPLPTRLVWLMKLPGSDVIDVIEGMDS